MKAKAWLLMAVLLLAACGGPGRPIRPQPTAPVVTRVPAPLPYPTLGPDEIEPAAVVERALAVPAAPTLLGWPRTFVITVSDDGVRWDGDVLLRWRHPAPPGVDYYEVWHGLDQPYLTPEREGTTTALRFLSDAPGQGLIYMAGTPGASIAGSLDTWRIAACNRAGCSAPSNEIGVMSFSLKQLMPFQGFLVGQ